MSFRIKAIPKEITTLVRKTLISPQYNGLKANVSIATGYGPCRSCLRVFEEGKEERIYFTYNSFEGVSNLPDPGPVFIHKENCETFHSSSLPPDILDLPVYFEAFGDQSSLIVRIRLEPTRAGSQIAELLEDENVRFINLRNAEAGCFIARIERS
jgi:hypothetical protein